MDVLTQIRKPIEREMADFESLFGITLQHQNALLTMALQHVLSRKGKLMRPILVLLAAKRYGKVNDAVLHAAVSLEMLHTASLVHDDVVDESGERRGQLSVNALMDNKAAVLVGDYLLSTSLKHAATAGSLEVVDIVARLGQTLSDGELQQLSNVKSDEISEEQYFDVIDSKTENGIRKVPIADKLLPYYKDWYNSCHDCEYLLHTEDGKRFLYLNYYDSYWTPLVEQIGIDRTPHCTRHTCISMLSEAGVQDTTIKKIVGHSGAMTLTEKVYTHLDMQVLVDAINKTLENEDSVTADTKSA